MKSRGFSRALILFGFLGVAFMACSDQTEEQSISKAEAAKRTKADDSTDYCALEDWYDDGTCDDFCLRPDPDCPEVNCLALPVEDCEANGCEVFRAHPYDVEQGCAKEELQPAFCQADPDIECFWQGDPIVMTAPDGTSWYMDWSCFSIPNDWVAEFFPEGKSLCQEEPPDCLELMVEECEANGCEVFRAYPYDVGQGCYQEELQPAFCRANPDIVCDWMGHPVVMTDSNGTSWYREWSCFAAPQDWELEFFPDGKNPCKASCSSLPDGGCIEYCDATPEEACGSENKFYRPDAACPIITTSPCNIDLEQGFACCSTQPPPPSF